MRSVQLLTQSTEVIVRSWRNGVAKTDGVHSRMCCHKTQHRRCPARGDLADLQRETVAIPHHQQQLILTNLHANLQLQLGSRWGSVKRHTIQSTAADIVLPDLSLTERPGMCGDCPGEDSLGSFNLQIPKKEVAGGQLQAQTRL